MKFNLSLTTKGEFIGSVNALLSSNPSKKYVVEITDKSKKRTLSANAQQHLWYSQIAKALGDRSALDVKNFCKDAIGLPIILNSAEHGDRMEFLLHKLDYYKHSYESRMKLIQCLEVTSSFNAAESKLYMEHMISYWNDCGVQIGFKSE